ncbi:MAG: phosphate ABC transporter permease PstA [Haloferacaceae archaeon]
MSGATETELVSEETSGFQALAGGTAALAAILFVFAVAALFELVSLTDPVAGVQVVAVVGGLLVLAGVGVVGFGTVSRLGMTATDPERSAGLIPGVVFSALWFVTGTLVGGYTLSLGPGGVVLGLVVAGVAFVATAFTREDVGSTVPAGAFSVFVGLVFLTALIGPSWSWAPAVFPSSNQVTFFATTTVPVAVGLCSLVVGWSAAKAYGGFGARGRHLGAYLLVYLNATAIVGVLFGLVAFVVSKGLPGIGTGFAVGAGVGPEVTVLGVTVSLPVTWPFVMNGVALMVEVDGVLPAIVGTVWLVVGAVVFAVPLGVGAAIYLSEYASQGRFTDVVEVVTNGLWSTPSIVFGLFGAAFLIPRFGGTKSLLAGMLTLGFMLLPLVVITSREAMLAVPDEYRDASAALGVSKWQTIRSVVLPAALPGVATGVILGVGRIAGETAPILLTMAGGTFVPGSQTVDVIGGFRFTAAPPFVANEALLQATSALPYQLYALITAGVGGQQIGDAQQFAWATALILLVVVLSFYAVGITTRYYFRRRLNR